jgi:hypothetical protein
MDGQRRRLPMRTLWALGGLALCLLVLAPGTQGATLLVPSQYARIQQAMDHAVAGDEIVVAPGVYADTTNYAHPTTDSTKCVVVMKSGVIVRGSGMGVTIIDGLHAARGFHAQDVTGGEIVGLTIRHCFNSWQDVYGAGIFCKNASPYIHNVEFVNNFDGALICVDGASPRVEWCVMNDNEAKAGAGLLVNPGCAPQLYDCRITNNRAPFATGAQLRSNALLDHCIISGNVTTGAGTVLGGGILAIDGANPTIVDCEITNNTCSGNGAGVSFVGDGTLGTMERCKVIGNHSTGLEGRGAGISVESSASPVIRGCVIARNDAAGQYSDGGGVYVIFSSLTMESCTLDGNWSASASAHAGNLGIETSMFVSSAISVTRTISSHSPAGRGVYCTGTGTDPTISCCDVFGNAGGDQFCGTGSDNFSLDPLLCDPANDNFHIATTSPCAPGHHPGGAQTCGGLLIGALGTGCFTGVDEPVAPEALLLGNRPNPFEGATTISLELPSSADVDLRIVDPAGRSLTVLHQGPLGAGEHRFTWDGLLRDGTSAGSGVYFARLRAGARTDAIRMLRLR